jgi:hypothetical protein
MTRPSVSVLLLLDVFAFRVNLSLLRDFSARQLLGLRLGLSVGLRIGVGVGLRVMVVTRRIVAACVIAGMHPALRLYLSCLH